MREVLGAIQVARMEQDGEVESLRPLHASLRPDKAFELGQGHGSLARWERQLAMWAATQRDLARRTGRDVSEIVMNRAEHFR